MTSGVGQRSRGCAVRRHRRRQARARPLSRARSRTVDRRRQHRRRLRASRPAHLARSRHRSLYARRHRRSGARMGTRRRDLEFHGCARPVRRRHLVQARRPRSCHARFAHRMVARRRHTQRICQPHRPVAGNYRSGFADVGRRGAHDRRNGRRRPAVSALFRAAALRARRERHSFPGRVGGNAVSRACSNCCQILPCAPSSSVRRIPTSASIRSFRFPEFATRSRTARRR